MSVYMSVKFTVFCMKIGSFCWLFCNFICAIFSVHFMIIEFSNALKAVNFFSKTQKKSTTLG